jgi:hypothetical protein
MVTSLTSNSTKIQSAKVIEVSSLLEEKQKQISIEYLDGDTQDYPDS